MLGTWKDYVYPVRILKIVNDGKGHMITFPAIHGQLIRQIRFETRQQLEVFKQVSLTPAGLCRAGFEPWDERRLAEKKSPVSTAQTIQPAQNI